MFRSFTMSLGFGGSFIPIYLLATYTHKTLLYYQYGPPFKRLVAIYRPMTLPEIKQLQKMIKALPPQNLDRVVELVERGKQAEKRSHDEIFVDLEKEVRERAEGYIL